jgi:hypothetical protein
MRCINLRERFPNFRIEWDESHVPGQADDPWLQEIPCRYGKIYPYGEDELCAYTDHPRLKRRLAALPGAFVHQRGDFELVVRFPAIEWRAYFELLAARRKRTATPAVRAALRKALDERRRRVSRSSEARSTQGAPQPIAESLEEAS